MTATARASVAATPRHLRIVRSTQEVDHEFADGHTLKRAFKKFSNKRRRDKAAELPASGEIACARIREFAYDIGAEMDFQYGWKAVAAERTGLLYSTVWNIIWGVVTTVSTATVDNVARHSGIPIRLFYDTETNVEGV